MFASNTRRLRIASVVALTTILSISLSVRFANAGEEIIFTDVEKQTHEFMEWYRTIPLTSKQDAVKKEALTSLPAPCCADNSAYTCCCECNMSRALWGLSHYMIAKQGADASQVRAKAEEWITFINPNGYSGKACYRRGCPRPFKHDGCGGMSANNVVF